MTYKKLSLFK